MQFRRDDFDLPRIRPGRRVGPGSDLAVNGESIIGATLP